MQFLDLSWWQSAIRGLMAMLCQLIYPLISGLYTLFMNVSKVNILSTDNVQPIYQRVTMILTIVMVFYVTFEAVKYVVQPDEITDKEKGAGKLVYKLIMVVILIAFVPTIFEWAFKLQTAIVDKGIIGRVIIGNKETDPSKFGPTFASSVFHMFYHVDEEDIEKTCENIKCGTLVQMNLYTLQNAGELPYLTVGLNASEQKNTGIDGKKAEMPLINFEFHGLLAVIVGGFIVYILALYCIDVGVRWAQMIFLQIVAPIPIIGYLSPKKDGIFQKWCQQCLTTYLDLFIRTAIIYFILLICSVLLDARESGNLFANLTGISGFMEILIYVVLILGVMMFAQKAPKLLEELFPKKGAASGNFGLSAKDRGLQGVGRVVGGVAGSAMGAVSGAATGIAQGIRASKALGKNGKQKGFGAGLWGATKGAVGGIVGGAARGAYYGSKKDGNLFSNSIEGSKKQIAANTRFGNRAENGYTLGHQIGDAVKNTLGMQSRVEQQEARKAQVQRHDDALKRVVDTESSIKKRALEKVAEGAASDPKAAPELQQAARKLAGTEARLKALEDPATAANEFRVGKYSASDSAKAQTDYANAVLLATSSVNRANFVDASGKFDKDGYERACAAAASQVSASDYAVAYNTQAEADAAYDSAKKAARAKVSRADYTSDAAFEAACKAAEDSINKDLFIQGYATEAEAQAALAAEIDSTRATLDEDQKAVVAAYAKYGDDPAISTMANELETYVNQYNATASATRQVHVNAQSITDDFRGFSGQVKKGVYRSAINDNATEVIELDAEIDRIKRETEGSGIGEGKK